MKKSRKQLLAAVLTVAMIVTLLVVPAGASRAMTGGEAAETPVADAVGAALTEAQRPVSAPAQAELLDTTPTEWNFRSSITSSTNLAASVPTVQGTTTTWQGLEIDATAGNFKSNGGEWAAFNTGCIIKAPVDAVNGQKVLVTVMSYSNGGTLEVDGTEKTANGGKLDVLPAVAQGGYVTITAKTNDYLGFLKVEPVSVPAPTEWSFHSSIGSSTNLAASVPAVEGQCTSWQNLLINAVNGKFKSNGNDWAAFNTGCIIKVPVDAEDDQKVNVTVMSYTKGPTLKVGTAPNDNAAQGTCTLQTTAKGGFITITATANDYLGVIKTEVVPDPLDTPLAPAGTGKVDVWDFGAEALEGDYFVNHLTVDILNGWTDSGGGFPKGETKTQDDLQITVPSGKTGRIRSSNSELQQNGGRYMKSAADIDPYFPTGDTYNGIFASNSGGDDGITVAVDGKRGDKVTYIYSENGNAASTLAFTAPSGEETEVEYAGSSDHRIADSHTFYLKEDGVHGLRYKTNKLYISRVYREAAKAVTVSGTVDTTQAADIGTDYKLVFTNTTSGIAVRVPVTDGAYSVTLCNYRSGAEYAVTLAKANDYVVATGGTFTVAASDATKTNNIALAAVSKVTVTGALNGLADLASGAKAADSAAALELTFTPKDTSAFVPEVSVDSAAKTYTAVLEKDIHYDVSVFGVNDYTFTAVTNKAFSADDTQDLTFTPKALQTVTIKADPAELDLSTATLTFIMLNEAGETEDQLKVPYDAAKGVYHYAYTFTGTDAIKLRAGTYHVKVSGADMLQKVTSNLTVADAAVEKTISFEPATHWDLRSSDYAAKSSAQHNYNGLIITGGKKHSDKYGMTSASSNGTIRIPVSDEGTILVHLIYTWDAYFEGDIANRKTNPPATPTDAGTDLSYTISADAVAAGYATLNIAPDDASSVITTYVTTIDYVPAAETVDLATTVTVGEGKDYATIGAALAAIKKMPRNNANPERVTVVIDPGTYYEILRVDTPNVTFKNASATPSIAFKNKGLDVDENAVRISWYYGTGYSYASMNSNYVFDADLMAVNAANGYASVENPAGGGTDCYWNATVGVSADGFMAENIIFENSFNQYISSAEKADTLFAQSGAKYPKGGTPRTDLAVNSVEVQRKGYVERAAAVGVANSSGKVFFDHCAFIGHQDILWGGTGVTMACYDCDIFGACDYIMAPMTAVFAKCDLVLNVGADDDTSDVAYITASQTKAAAPTRGYLMYNCHVRSVVPGVERGGLETITALQHEFGRAWEGVTGEAVFYETTVDNNAANKPLISATGWNSGLNKSARCADYHTHTADGSLLAGPRASWSGGILETAATADGADLTDYETWLGGWDILDDKDMTVVCPDVADGLTALQETIEDAETIYSLFDDADLILDVAPSEVERGAEFVSTAVAQALKDAIATAQDVVDSVSGSTTEQELAEAKDTLQDAIDAFKAAKQTGTKAPDTTELASALDALKASVADVKVVDKTADQVDQGVAFITTADKAKVDAAVAEAERVIAAAATTATVEDVDNALAGLEAVADCVQTGTCEPSMTLASDTASVKVGATTSVAVHVAGYTYSGKSVYAIAEDAAIAGVKVVDGSVEVTGVAVGTTSVYVIMTDAQTVTVDAAKADATMQLLSVTVTKKTTTSVTGGGTTTTPVTTITTNDQGDVATTVTQPNGDKDITVVNAEGETVAEITIPGKIVGTPKFKDVPAGHWAEASINNMAAMGMVKGVNEAQDEFDMTSAMTRGAIATMFFRLSNGGEGMENTFADVAAGSWYADAVGWAAKTGVVNGYSQDAFGPDDTIGRQQLAVMIFRFARLIGLDVEANTSALTAFADGDAVDSWAVDGMAWCVKNGVMKGRGDGTLDPTTSVTRAEAAVMFDRMIALVQK